METQLQLALDFADAHPAEAAQVLEPLGTEAALALLAELDEAGATEVLRQMDSFFAAQCLETMSEERASALVGGLTLEKTASLLRRVAEERQQALLARQLPPRREPLEVLLRYPEGTAGALMNPRVLTLSPEMTVSAALERVRSRPREATYYLYVLDRDQNLEGVVNMRELMVADQSARVDALMRRDVVRIPAAASLEAVLAHPGWLEFHVLPVVDEKGLFIGALRHKNLRRLASEGGRRRGGGVQVAGAALAELYRIGLAGLLRGTADGLGVAEE